MTSPPLSSSPAVAAADEAAVSGSPVLESPPAPGRAEALRYWLGLGCLSFGGPAGQIALMHEALVERKRWISERRFLHALNYCMVLPGPEAQQLATYLGWLMHGTWGGVVAGALFVLPALALLIGLSWIYMAYGHLPVIAGLFYGIKPAVTALVLQAAWRLGGRTLHSASLWGVAALAFAAIALLQLPFPLIVLAAGLIGALLGRLAPGQLGRAGGHAGSHPGGQGAKHGAGAAAQAGRAVIDDDTPTPPHARFQWRGLLRVCAVCGGLWLLVMGGLVAGWGWQGALAQMGWFFTQAALLTFGGAYAVLPFVVQGAVDQHQWLSTAQMMDGLALGETTPGPLIMVVSFVGFVGGWGQAILGPGTSPGLSGTLAALVVTFFTFLPSFFFILLGGPLIETTHGRLGFTAPLTAISAAVVGVILNLALFFGLHVLWPQGWAGGFDVAAAAIGLLAALALLRWKRGVIEVIVTAALAGLAWRLLRG